MLRELTETDYLQSIWQALKRLEDALDLPAPVVNVTPPDLSDIVTAVVGLKPGPSAAEIAEAIAGVLQPGREENGSDALLEVAKALEKLDFRLKGLGTQAYGGGSVSFSKAGLEQLSSVIGGGGGGPTGGLTDAELRASPVEVVGDLEVTGGLTDAELRAAPVEVTGDFASDGLTDVELRATPVEVTVVGGSPTGGLTDTELRATPVVVDLNNIDGAATEATLADTLATLGDILVKLDDLLEPGGSVDVGNFPSTYPVTDNGGSLTVDGTFWQATQPVSGTFWQATQPVSGPLTDTQLRATPVPVSGTVAATLSEPISVDDNGGSITVDGTFWQATQPVSGPVTDAQLRAVPVPVSGTVAATLSEPISVDDNGGSLTVDGTFWQATQPVSGTFFQATQPVSGTFWQATQPVSGTVTATAGEGKAEDAPAASGDTGIPILAVRNDAAASKTTLDGDYSMLATDAAGRMGICDLGGTVSIDDGAGSLTVDGTFWQATQPVSGTFWQATQPVSGTVTANLAAGTNNIGDVDVLSLPSIPAGNNNIGDVDIASIAAGNNNIGDVDIASVPAPLNVVGGGTEAAALRVTIANNSTGVLAVDTEIQAASTLADTFTNPSTGRVGSLAHLFNGTTWDRARGDTTNGLDVDVTRVSGNVAVTGTFWQAAQPITDNAGSLTVDAPVGTPVFVRLSDGSATLIGQKAMTASLPVVLASDQASVPVANTDTRPATGTLANVSGSASSVTLQASNTARRGLAIVNDSTVNLFVKFGSTASATSYTVKMIPGAYYELPQPCYSGIVTGIWDSATGSARMTEIT